MVAEGREGLLDRGDIIFPPPGEFHALRATGNSAPNLVVASFYCDCSELERLSGRTYKTKEAERVLIGGLVSEAELAFSSPLDDPMTTALERRECAAYGSDQPVGADIGELLIGLLPPRAGGRPGHGPLLAPRRGDVRTWWVESLG